MHFIQGFSMPSINAHTFLAQPCYAITKEQKHQVEVPAMRKEEFFPGAVEADSECCRTGRFVSHQRLPHRMSTALMLRS